MRKTMHPRDALNQAMKVFNIKPSYISKKTGLASSYISRFRNGYANNDISSENLMKIVRALPDEVKPYFFALCMQEDEEEQPEAAA